MYGLAASTAVVAPESISRQRAVIESTSNTAGCLAFTLSRVDPPSSMPLRFLLAAVGSSGDVNPVIGLGAALRARGHEVELATNELFQPQVAAAGLAFVPLGTAAEAEGIMADPRLWHPIRGFACIAERALLPNLAPLYRLIEARRDRGIRVAATTLCLGARAATLNSETARMLPGTSRK